MARAKNDPCKFLYLGGLFGVINTDKDNSPSIVNGCSNSGAITSRSNVKQLYIGGVAGLLDSPNTTLTDNTSSGNITTTKRLRNLYCGGLFGAINQSVELNLNGEPCTGFIKIGTIESSASSYLYCGGLIGQTTADVKVSGSATWKSSLSYVVKATAGDNIAAESFFGGICGCAYGASINLSGMKSEGTIAIDTLKHTISGVGGIIGGATKGTSISDCSNSSKVSVKANNVKTNGYSVHVGGIAGRIFGGDVIIKRCTNTARIESRHFNNNPWISYNGNVAGGIVGSVGYSEDNNFLATIEDCHNSGTVYSFRGASGGIVGYVSKGTMKGCGFTGSITRSAPGGGIAGVANSSVISECYVKASIKTAAAGSTNADCGGIVGEAVSSTVDGCRYYGELIPAAKVSTGGIIGKADAASSAGVTTACGFGGKINGTTVTETNLSTCAIGSTTGKRGNFYLWNGVLQ